MMRVSVYPFLIGLFLCFGDLCAQFKNMKLQQPPADSLLSPVESCRGPRGELYHCYATAKGLAFQRSLNGDGNGMTQELIIDTISSGWKYSVNGSPSNGLPTIACDLSPGMYSGRIYICWGNQKYGVNNKDVLLVYSDDRGDHWTEPILVTYRPNHKEQFKPAMAIDQSSGCLYLLYFDRQNYATGNFTDLYLATSDNGGLLFSYYKLNEGPLPVNANIRLQNSLRIRKEHVAEISWTRGIEKNKPAFLKTNVNDSLLQLYTARAAANELTTGKTLDFSDTLCVSFSYPEKLILDAVITKPLEPSYQKIVLLHKAFAAGRQSFRLYPKTLGIGNGNYVLTLYYRGKNTYLWILEK